MGRAEELPADAQSERRICGFRDPNAISLVLRTYPPTCAHAPSAAHFTLSQALHCRVGRPARIHRRHPKSVGSFLTAVARSLAPSARQVDQLLCILSKAVRCAVAPSKSTRQSLKCHSRAVCKYRGHARCCTFGGAGEINLILYVWLKGPY
jgi:hypothetical protein